MKNIFVTLLLFILPFLMMKGASCYAQSQDLVDCHNRINNLLKEYQSQITPQFVDSRVTLKNIKVTYQHPNMIISYDTRIRPGYTPLFSTKLGKNSVSFPLRNSKFLLDYNRINIFSDEIEFVECGEKRLEGMWSFYTSGSSFTLIRKIFNELSRYKRLIIETSFNGNLGISTAIKTTTKTSNRITIKMQKEASNVYKIPCKINGLSLKFIFDTGASSVLISQSEALFMLRNGYLSPEDFVGTQKYQTANGDIIEGTKIIIKKMEIGGIMLQNVEASIVHNNNAPLLLGQSVLNRLGKIEIDYSNSTLTIIR